MDPWSKGVLVAMALIAVWTCLSVLIERDEQRSGPARRRIGWLGYSVSSINCRAD
jgi:hypothetical protein